MHGKYIQAISVRNKKLAECQKHWILPYCQNSKSWNKCYNETNLSALGILCIHCNLKICKETNNVEQKQSTWETTA